MGLQVTVHILSRREILPTVHTQEAPIIVVDLLVLPVLVQPPELLLALRTAPDLLRVQLHVAVELVKRHIVPLARYAVVHHRRGLIQRNMLAVNVILDRQYAIERFTTHWAVGWSFRCQRV